MTRVTGSGQVLCPSFVEEDQSTTTSPSVTTTIFTGLQEFSSYTVRVTANFSPAFGLSAPMAEESMTFTTLSSGKLAIFGENRIKISIGIHTSQLQLDF